MKKMYHSLFLLCFAINTISTADQPCSMLNRKLNRYGIKINNQEKAFPPLRICQGLIEDSCCPQIYEDRIQNATATELYHLFELHSIRLYEPLLRLTIEFNETMNKLIESSRNETHALLQPAFNSYYHFYRPSVDLFFNRFLRMSSRNYQHDTKSNIEEFFRNMLRVSMVLNHDNKPPSSSYLMCLWRNHPFGNRPNLIGNKLQIHLGKLFHLNELFKLSIELIQVMSTSVTTDYHCIDSFMQLSYCNLCSGREQAPCPSNCANVIESCLVNVTLINDVWMKFIDSLENVGYFDGIEKVLSWIGSSISDALVTFFHSDEILNKDVCTSRFELHQYLTHVFAKIIDQCGSVRIRKEIFASGQQHRNQHGTSLSSSVLDPQLLSIRQTMKVYRSFWLTLPKDICRPNEQSLSNERECWTGSSISQDKSRESMRINYDKPLSLRLQWILKEMKEKSRLMGDKQAAPTVTMKNSPLFNLTDDLDDYPSDEEFDYSDYAYEDPADELTSTTITTTTTIRSTTIQSSSTSVYDDIPSDDMNTVAYYDYAEQDLYMDDVWNETSTGRLSPIPTTTAAMRVPSYHRRRPILWNINIDKDHLKAQNSSCSLHCSFLFLFFIFILT